MAEQDERSTLNHLIETCRDGERGFRYAANHVNDPAVKSLFLEVASQREQFINELRPHAQRLGGANDTDGTVAAALHRGWMTIRDTLSGHEDATVIAEAERGERSALAAYDDALNGIVPPTARDLIERQREEIRRSRERVQALLNVG